MNATCEPLHAETVKISLTAAKTTLIPVTMVVTVQYPTCSVVSRAREVEPVSKMLAQHTKI